MTDYPTFEGCERVPMGNNVAAITVPTSTAGVYLWITAESFDGYPADLMDGLPAIVSVRDRNGELIWPWFYRAHGGEDLQALTSTITKALKLNQLLGMKTEEMADKWRDDQIKPKPEKFVTATGFEIEDVYASAESLGLDVTHEQAQAFLREWHDKIDERADAAGRAVIDDELGEFINGG